MKFTPLILFLILILVLILSVVFSRFFPIQHSNQEGMIDYSNTVASLNSVTITPYSSSKQVTKLYDNIFFDTGNSNIIIVDGKLRGNINANIAAIQNIRVLKPDSTIGAASIAGNSQIDSEISKLTFPSMANWWTDVTNTSLNTDQYQMFYFSWDRSRFIHLMKKPTGVSGQAQLNLFNLGSYYFNRDGDTKEMIDYAPRSEISISTSSVSANSMDGTYVLVTEYDEKHKVYQINSRLFFDIRNGNLIVKSGANIKAYKRDSTDFSAPFTSIPNTIQNTRNFISWMKSNEISTGSLVLYMAIAQKTLIAVIKLQGNGDITLDKVIRFNKDGVDPGIRWESDASNNDFAQSDGTANYGAEYMKWLAYWNSLIKSRSLYDGDSQGGGISYGSSSYNDPLYSNDYILKTQVVPPVCPACPSCPSSGICTNCGGGGGSGTLGGNGTTIAGGKGGAGNAEVPANLTASGSGAFATTANPDTLGGATTIQTMGVVKGAENVVNTAAGAASRTVDTAGNIIQKTGSGTVDLLKTTGSGASNLITSGVSGAAGLAKETVGGAVGLAKETVGGVVGLAKDFGSGVANVLTRDNRGNTQQSSGGSGGSGGSSGSGNRGNNQQSQSRIDPYSYGGALVSKPSNYIPVTADFSAFAK